MRKKSTYFDILLLPLCQLFISKNGWNEVTGAPTFFYVSSYFIRIIIVQNFNMYQIILITDTVGPSLMYTKRPLFTPTA